MASYLCAQQATRRLSGALGRWPRLGGELVIHQGGWASGDAFRVLRGSSSLGNFLNPTFTCPNSAHSALQQGRHALGTVSAAPAFNGSSSGNRWNRPLAPGRHAARRGPQASPSRWAASGTAGTTSAGAEAATSCDDYGKCFEARMDAECHQAAALGLHDLHRLVAW
jgi:hypothetical protein